MCATYTNTKCNRNLFSFYGDGTGRQKQRQFKHSLYRPGQALRVPGRRVKEGNRGVYILGINFLLIRYLNFWK
jgi:hypothetical protein